MVSREWLLLILVNSSPLLSRRETLEFRCWYWALEVLPILMTSRWRTWVWSQMGIWLGRITCLICAIELAFLYTHCEGGIRILSLQTLGCCLSGPSLCRTSLIAVSYFFQSDAESIHKLKVSYCVRFIYNWSGVPVFSLYLGLLWDVTCLSILNTELCSLS